jgi:hypothetical protein
MGGGNDSENVRLLCAGCERRQAGGAQHRIHTASPSRYAH